MHLRRMMVPSLLCLAALLTGCSASNRDVVFQTEVRVPEVPKALRSCKNAPTPPGAQKRTQKDVANYLVRLKDAHDDCQDKLDDVDDLLTQNENKAKDFNRQQQQQAK